MKEENILLSFVLYESNVEKILNEYSINKEKILYYFPNLAPKENIKTSSLIAFFSSLLKEKVSNKQQKIEFSKNINYLIEKSLDNAYERFKTPVVTPEIFFITLMEARHLKIGKIIKKLLIDDMNWYTLRYKLIKNIHFEESHIRNDVIKNQRLFAYLLKTQLSQLEFFRLLDIKILDVAVLYFRTLLINQTLEPKNLLFEQMKRDIYYSAKVNRRKYSKKPLISTLNK